LGELDYYKYNQYSKTKSSITNLVWQMSRGVLRDWAGCVWWHIFEDPTQSLDDVFIVDFITGHPRRVIIARILVPEGIACHQWMHLRFMKLKATCSALSPTSLKSLIFYGSSGS
jgi:hypothetical protein